MRGHDSAWNRRDLLKCGSAVLAACVTATLPVSLLAQEMAVLDVASAGSFRPMTDGPLKPAAAQRLHLDLHSHAQGADAVAHSLVDGTLYADVFIPITAGPMHTVMQAGLAQTAYPIARTEMVLLYSPKGRYAAQFATAAEGRGNWWEILQRPGINFARGNPADDPGGRNAFFVLMLAAKKYGHPELVEKLLGSTTNLPPAGRNNIAKLESGEIDAATSYRVGTSFNSLPYLVLPKALNLSGDHVAADNPDVSLQIGSKIFRPEPLVFYGAALKNATNPTGARAFLDWLKGDEARALLGKDHYDAPGRANVLHV